MARGKKLKIGAILLLLGLLFSTPISAEVGNSGGFDDGGSDWGGSDWDSGSSWDYDDNDYDYSSSGGGGSSSLSLPITLLILCVYLPGMALFIFVKQRGAKQRAARYSNNSNSGSGSRFNTDAIDEQGTINKIIAVDPDFSVMSFKQNATELYINLQEAWEAKDWKSIRTFESNSLFNTHRKQLQEYIDQGKTNKLDDQDVRSVELADFYVDGDQEVLIIRLNATCIDYTIDDQTGAVIQGDKTTVYKRSYYLQFIRKAGIKTKTDHELNLKVCPNCGAEIEVSESGECEYCKSVITSGEYGWVLNKYGAYKALRRN